MMRPELLGRLMDDHVDALVLYARQWCNSPEDVVQEAFLKLSSVTPTPTSLVPWLYRVVRNGAISQGRRASRQRRHESAAAARISEWFTASPAIGLDIEAATAALQTLDDEQREAIIAHLWCSLTFEQIAHVMNSSSTSVNRWYLAGLSILRQKLGVPCPKR